ncbi:hypothetical protein PTTG_06624, partial [Puccinia triticina 1-1 BBBD Race 1]
MLGLNIQDASNSIKAAAQQTAHEAGEGSQMASPKGTPQESDTDAVAPDVLFQNPGPPPKTSKQAKPPKNKVTTQAAAKNLPNAPCIKQAKDAPTTRAPPPNPAAEEESEEVDLEKEARAIILAKMIKAKKAGNEVKAERYSKMYKAILADQKPKASKVVVDNECKGPLPLTIFNREWQEKALSYHSKNHPKTDETAAEKGLRYHGYPVPDEFSQNFSEWTLNYLKMRDRYNYPVLAKWILAHKEHCDWLHQTQGFMVTLRYDIWIRNNAFAFQQETANEAISTCRDFNKIGLLDNPYAIGDGKVGGDAFKGIKLLKTKQVNHIPQSSQTKTKASHKEPSVEPLSQAQGHSSLPAKPDQSR